MPNIFEEAGRSKPKPKPKPASASPMQSKEKETVPFGTSKNKEELDKLIHHPTSIKLKDVDQVIVRVREMHDEIEKKLEAIYQKTGLTPKYVRDYLANPNNFNSFEWDRIQKNRQELLGSLLGSTKVEETQEQKAKSAEKATEKSTKERRGKMVGTRKNWIPIR